MFPLYDNNPHRRTPWFTLLIIAVNLGVNLYMSMQPEVRQRELIAHFGFVPERVEQLSNPKLVVEVKLDDDAPLAPGQQPPAGIRIAANPGQIYLSMFTMMFLHGGWLHVLGNVWFLWLFGNNIEDRLGHVIFLMFYLLGGLLAVAVHYFTDPHSNVPCVGASGAVAAVLGAYALTYPRAKVRTLIFLGFILLVDIPALVVLGLWFVQQLLSALNIWNLGMNGGVAWWAHVGGFAAGLLLMPLLALGAPPPDADWHAEAKRMFDFD